MSTRKFRVPALLLLLFGSCVGGQTGGEVGGTPPGSVGGDGGGSATLNVETEDHCLETSRPLAIDELSSLGFTPNQILSWAGGEHSASFEWGTQSAGWVLVYTPEVGENTLTVTVSAQGDAEFVHSEPMPWGEAGAGGRLGGSSELAASSEHAERCADRVEIYVSVRVQTSGGALDELFEAELVAKEAQQASLAIRLDLALLSGSLVVELSDPPDGLIDDVLFSATFTPGGFSGELRCTASVENESVAQAAPITMAQWDERS